MIMASLLLARMLRRARWVVLRELCDAFENAGTARVVEHPRRKRAGSPDQAALNFPDQHFACIQRGGAIQVECDGVCNHVSKTR